MSKASSDANQLWPYLIKKVERVVKSVQGSAAGSAGVGGAPSPHDLSGAHHTGTLANSQGPQFLLVNGSRALTGNLTVAAGIQIDGVDLSAHAADPDAHHARATAGNTGISVTGQAISVALATTSGLAISSGLKVGAGDGIDVLTSTIAVDVTDFIDTAYGLTESSNDIRINKATNSGLAFDGGGALTLGTPTAVTVSSTNSVTGVAHTHAVTASSDVGTSPAAALLKSTGSGGLILGTLTVKGSVDITNGGDLTVGSNVLFVDVSQGSVGIMRAPDPQFALDVNGPIRGTEIVGKHAIQLDDLEVLLHFDGGFPYETNYTGEPNAIPMGQVPTINTGVHYRPGKFYKAAVFGKTGTNLCPNPSFETSTSGWAISNDAGGDLAISRASDDSWYGSYSGKLTWTAVNNSRAYIQGSPSSTASSYTFSCWMRASVPLSVLMRLGRDDSPYTSYADKYVSVTEEWQRFSVTALSPGGVPLRLSIFPTVASSTIWVDGVQLENYGEPTLYMDGSLGDGYAWSGTEHLSSSTRGNGYMAYTLNEMVEHRWTMMGWFCYPNAAPIANNGGLYMQMVGGDYVRITQSGSAGFSCGVQHSGGTATPVLQSGNLVPDQWYHVVLTYTTGLLRGYINGVEVLSAAYTIEGKPNLLYVGAINGPQYGSLMLDDVVVSRQSLTANRVRAIYGSDAPVFATSSVFSFRATPKGLVWADEEGLWMRDVDGTPVMGFYGGDAATKSWAGFTLARGDITFGQYGASDGGWLLFDRDGVSSKPYLSLGYANKTVIAFDALGASLDGVLDIGTSGGIYQGSSGSFLSPGTGLKVWNSGGVGLIGGYNGGVAQWYANTDGKLYAGGGDVVLDVNGILVDETGGTGAYLEMRPSGGMRIGSLDSTVLNWISTGFSTSGSGGFAGINFEHVAQPAYFSISLAEQGTTHQAQLFLGNYGSPNKAELLIGAEVYNGSPSTNDAEIILKAVAWSSAPFAKEARINISGYNEKISLYGDVYIPNDNLFLSSGSISVAGGSIQHTRHPSNRYWYSYADDGYRVSSTQLNIVAFNMESYSSATVRISYSQYNTTTSGDERFLDLGVVTITYTLSSFVLVNTTTLGASAGITIGYTTSGNRILLYLVRSGGIALSSTDARRNVMLEIMGGVSNISVGPSSI